MDGITVAAIMAADELEDYLELKNPKVQTAIAKSNRDIKTGRIKPAEDLLAEQEEENRDHLSVAINDAWFFGPGNRDVRTRVPKAPQRPRYLGATSRA